MRLAAHPALRSSVAHSKGDIGIARLDSAACLIAHDVRIFPGGTPCETSLATGNKTPKRHRTIPTPTVLALQHPCCKPARGQGDRTYWINGTVDTHNNALNPFNNEFVSFAGNGDGQFHNISQSAFLAAVGMAQTTYRAPWSFTAIATANQTESTSTSGGFFTQTTTTTVKTYVKPNWLLGLPIEQGGPDRFTTNYCLSSSQTSNCPANMVVHAGVSFITFNGGNMPMQSILADEQQQSSSGFTMLAFAVFTAILAVVTAGMYLAVAGAGATILGSMGLGTIALAAGGTYLGLNMITKGGPATSGQNGWFDGLTNGSAASQATGNFGDPTNGITASWVSPDLNNITDIHNALQAGAPRSLFVGSCPVQYTYDQCKNMGYVGNTAGLVQRADTWVEQNRVEMMRNGQIPQQTVPVGGIDPNALLNGTATLP